MTEEEGRSGTLTGNQRLKRSSEAEMRGRKGHEQKSFTGEKKKTATMTTQSRRLFSSRHFAASSLSFAPLPHPSHALKTTSQMVATLLRQKRELKRQLQKYWCVGRWTGREEMSRA
jgi:hypothetical protein